MIPQRYPRLAEFVSSWFHQDFDLEGETVADVVHSYKTVSPPEQQRELRDDISQFLMECSDDLDVQFERIFQPDVIPSALSGSARAFLETIRDLLAP